MAPKVISGLSQATVATHAAIVGAPSNLGGQSHAPPPRPIHTHTLPNPSPACLPVFVLSPTQPRSLVCSSRSTSLFPFLSCCQSSLFLTAVSTNPLSFYAYPIPLHLPPRPPSQVPSPNPPQPTSYRRTLFLFESFSSRSPFLLFLFRSQLSHRRSNPKSQRSLLAHDSHSPRNDTKETTAFRFNWFPVTVTRQQHHQKQITPPGPQPPTSTALSLTLIRLEVACNPLLCCVLVAVSPSTLSPR